MTNTIALWLAALVGLFLVTDALFFDGFARFFLASRTIDLVEWVAFWR